MIREIDRNVARRYLLDSIHEYNELIEIFRIGRDYGPKVCLEEVRDKLQEIYNNWEKEKEDE